MTFLAERHTALCVPVSASSRDKARQYENHTRENFYKGFVFLKKKKYSDW